MPLEQEQNQTGELPEGYSWVPKKGSDTGVGLKLFDPNGIQVGSAHMSLTKSGEWGFSNVKNRKVVSGLESLHEAKKALLEDMFPPDPRPKGPITLDVLSHYKNIVGPNKFPESLLETIPKELREQPLDNDAITNDVIAKLNDIRSTITDELQSIVGSDIAILEKLINNPRGTKNSSEDVKILVRKIKFLSALATMKFN